MKSIVLHSLKWVAIGKILGQSVRWLTTIFTLRFLFPEDYAVIALSSFFTSLLWAFSKNGIAAALIREKDVDDDILGQFYTLTIIAHTSLFLFLQLLAPVLAGVYDDPRLEDVIRVSSLTFLISLIGFMSGTMLNKEMRFKKLSMVDAASESVGALSTVFMAWYGLGYWSIVFGVLAMETVRQTGYLIRAGKWVRPGKLTSKIKGILDFSWKAALQATVGYSIFNLDIAIAGLYLSTTDLGFYQFAAVLAMMPAVKVLPLLRQVALPVYSKIQDQASQIEYYFLKSQRMSALLFVPVFWGVAATANTMVPAFFGEKWVPAAIIITLYCLSMPMRSLEQLFGPVLKSLNKMNVIIVNTIIFAAILIPGFYIGAQFGSGGMALSWLFSFFISFMIASYRSCRCLNIRFKRFIGAVYKPHLIGLCMLTATWWLGQYLMQSMTPWLVFIIQVFTGGVIYTGLSLLCARKESMELINLVRNRNSK